MSAINFRTIRLTTTPVELVTDHVIVFGSHSNIGHSLMNLPGPRLEKSTVLLILLPIDDPTRDVTEFVGQGVPKLLLAIDDLGGQFDLNRFSGLMTIPILEDRPLGPTGGRIQPFTPNQSKFTRQATLEDLVIQFIDQFHRQRVPLLGKRYRFWGPRLFRWFCFDDGIGGRPIASLWFCDLNRFHIGGGRNNH